MSQCKFSLYLKKAGLASRNIVHSKTYFYVVSVYASLIMCYKRETVQRRSALEKRGVLEKGSVRKEGRVTGACEVGSFRK